MSLQSIASARSQVSSTLGPVQSQVNMLHNQTVDRITGYQKQYQPTVQHYDQMYAPSSPSPMLHNGC